MENNGLRPYLYEYVFFRAIESLRMSSGQPFMISHARRVRADVEARMTALGSSMHDPQAKISDVLNSIEGALVEGVAGYQPGSVLGDPSAGSSNSYAAISQDFMAMVGRPVRTRDGSSRVFPPGPMGVRIPVSPYDSRFADRATVKASGSQLLYVPESTVDEMLDGDPARLARVRNPVVKFYAADPNGERLRSQGSVYDIEDLTGLSRLMGFMSQNEYGEVREWVIQGGRDPRTGRIDPDRYMSEEALDRAVAILSELQEQGTPYTISRDRNHGQIQAQVGNRGISVRLMDVREQERFVGRVYDNGVSISFSTLVKQPGGTKTVEYVPSAQDCVALLRYAQGHAVPRLDGKGVVGVPGTYEVARFRGRVQESETQNDSYFSGTAHSAIFGDLPGHPGAHVRIRREGKDRTARSRFFKTAEEGREFLIDAVASARQNLATALDVERLVSESQEHQDEIAAGEYAPAFHGDVQIAAIQRSYWDVLTGARSALLLPGASEQEYNEKIGAIGEMTMDEESGASAHQLLMGNITYAGSPVDQVRDHAVDVLDAMVGSFESREVFREDTGESSIQRFDPVGVSRYMSGEHGVWRNNDDIIAAMRVAEIDPGELFGSNFYNTVVRDRMVRFDQDSSRDMLTDDDAFVRRMGETIAEAISRNGCRLQSLSIDGQGVCRYTAEQVGALSASAAKANRPVVGEIGQIFSTGDEGEIVTRFASGENYMFVPGYEARIVAQRPGEWLSVEERTRLRGYEQIMREQIEYQIASDMMTARSDLGEPTSLNVVYRRLYDVRHEVDFIERSREEGLSDSWREAIVQTERRRVRYGNEIREGSTINADYQAKADIGRRDPSDDNFFDPYVLTGGRNMSILTEQGDGYFDPIMTSGSTNQGIIRYLVEGAQVAPDGTIVRGQVDDRTPLMKHPEAAQMVFDPFDRQQMTASNLMQAAAVTAPTGTAMITFGGWNFDDGMVVSRRFADRYQIRGTDGAMRSLVVGDKLSDMHGNKGVISLVVDPSMDLEQAQDQGLLDAVEVFRANMDLDVVMSPFSAVSRFNGGSARELMANARDLYWDEAGENPYALVERRSVESALGDVRFIVTHMAVDAKTRIYGDEDLSAGRGRKASGQLAWALGSQGCSKVLAECYGTNNNAVANLREMLTVIGMDMGADGSIHMGRVRQSEQDVRRRIEIPELVRRDGGNLDMSRMRREFGMLIGDRGGDLVMPFPLAYPSIGGAARLEVPRDETGGWLLPVLSSHLRSGQELDDGTMTTHDYTNHYLSIYEQGCRYVDAKERLADPDLAPAKRESLQAILQDAPMRAQTAFSSITDDLVRRKFSGKHNVFKDQIMASRMPNSATAVWSADPRLDIDQVAMGPAMAEALEVKEDDYVLVWRDPMLRDAGVRYLRVALDDRLTGVAINPVMDKGFDGDFDGDAVAIVKLNTKSAQLEAMQKLTVQVNLLDKGTRLEDGNYPLLMQDALDVKVTQHEESSYVDRFAELTERANEIHFDLEAGDIDQATAWDQRQQVVSDLSDYYRSSLGVQYGGAVLQFGDVQQHIDSVRRSCVETGAKGSEAKVRDYGHYLGVTIDEDWRVTDNGISGRTRADDEAVEYATAVKSFGTGVAGTFSQRGVKALRNSELTAVLELTYPVTQSILQSKHDPVDARHKYELLMGPARKLWRGRQLVELVSGSQRGWEVARNERGDEVQAPKDVWEQQFMELYTAKDGLNVAVNAEHVRAVADALSSDGVMLDLEDKALNLASPMDKLAYGGDFDTLCDVAIKHGKLFDGDVNYNFAPFVVRRNIRSMQATAQPQPHDLAVKVVAEVREPDPIQVIARRDVQSGTAGRSDQRRSPHARTAGNPSRAAAAVLEGYESQPDTDDGFEM